MLNRNADKYYITAKTLGGESSIETADYDYAIKFIKDVAGHCDLLRVTEETAHRIPWDVELFGGYDDRRDDEVRPLHELTGYERQGPPIVVSGVAARSWTPVDGLPDLKRNDLVRINAQAATVEWQRPCLAYINGVHGMSGWVIGFSDGLVEVVIDERSQHYPVCVLQVTKDANGNNAVWDGIHAVQD